MLLSSDVQGTSPYDKAEYNCRLRIDCLYAGGLFHCHELSAGPPDNGRASCFAAVHAVLAAIVHCANSSIIGTYIDSKTMGSGGGGNGEDTLTAKIRTVYSQLGVCVCIYRAVRCVSLYNIIKFNHI